LERSIDGSVVNVRNDLLMVYFINPERCFDVSQVGSTKKENVTFKVTFS